MHIAYNYLEISLLFLIPNNSSTTKAKLELLAAGLSRAKYQLAGRVIVNCCELFLDRLISRNNPKLTRERNEKKLPYFDVFLYTDFIGRCRRNHNGVNIKIADISKSTSEIKVNEVRF